MGTFDINIHPRGEGIDFIQVKSPPIDRGMVDLLGAILDRCITMED